MSISYGLIGDKIKSGSVSLTDNTWVAVTFAKAFQNTPNVVATMVDESGIIENLSVKNITSAGFEIKQELKTAATKTVQWLATDVGDISP